MMHRFLRMAVAAVLLCIVATASAKVYLVAVGISDYPGTDHDLRLPTADAKTIVWLYNKNGNTEYRLLLDSEATVANITSAITSVFAKAGANDVVVFFYSGHGYTGGFYVYDGNLDYGRVRAAMAQTKSTRKMMFADACHAGKMGTPGKDDNASLAAAKDADVMLFLSSRADEYSIERSLTMSNGFFTQRS